MRARLFELSLLAYPRAVRAGDREHLRDLAMELADDHGAVREVLGLLRGGLAERWHRRRRAGRAMVAVVAAAVVTVAALTWTAAAHGGRVDEEVFSCVGDCADAEAEVASLVRTGWSCAERRGPAGLDWRCTRD